MTCLLDQKSGARQKQDLERYLEKQIKGAKASKESRGRSIYLGADGETVIIHNPHKTPPGTVIRKPNGSSAQEFYDGQ